MKLHLQSYQNRMNLVLPDLICLASLIGLSSFAFAQELVATDPKDAGSDYPIQGEYAGKDFAAQVIAQGDGRFHVVLWQPGLPGLSLDATRKMEFEAATADGKTAFSGEQGKGQIARNEMMFKAGTAVRKAKRVERKSPALNAKPPHGATVLFKGSDTDEWEGGRMTQENFLLPGTRTKRTYQDFTLHIEFRLPFKPFAKGQDRGNSGVYLQNRYEVQVLDSFGLSGENNEAGGIYEISKPKVNMCYPPLQWQTYGIDFTAAKYDAEGKKAANAVVSVRHNGVLVQDKIEVPNSTRASGLAEGPEPGPIYLQDHGNPVIYRNIWIVEKKK